jgi:hypothetical protein
MNYETFDECVRVAMEDDEILNGDGAIIFRLQNTYHYHPLNEKNLELEEQWAIIERSGQPNLWLLLPQTKDAVTDKDNYFTNPDNPTKYFKE